jgi:hypothetical protein
MAILKITPTLRNEITRKAAEPFETAITNLLTITNPKDVDLLYATVVPPDLEQTLCSLPKEWSINFGTEMRMRVKNANMHIMSLYLKFKRRPCMYSWTHGVSYPPVNNWKEPRPIGVESQYNSTWPKIELSVFNALGLSVNYADKCAELAKDRDTLLAGINKVLDSAPTINSVIKIWPAIETYLSDEKKTKLHEVIERKSTSKIKEELNLDELNVAHITQRMAGGV